MTTITQAKDDISAAFYDGWTLSETSKNIPVFFDNLDSDADDKSADAPWARLSIKHFDSAFSKQSLADSDGVKNYQRDGIATVGIFVPIGEGASRSDELISIVMNSFEGKRTANGVWFRNVRFNEVGPDGAWFQINIKANFNYTENK